MPVQRLIAKPLPLPNRSNGFPSIDRKLQNSIFQATTPSEINLSFSMAPPPHPRRVNVERLLSVLFRAPLANVPGNIELVGVWGRALKKLRLISKGVDSTQVIL